MVFSQLSQTQPRHTGGCCSFVEEFSRAFFPPIRPRMGRVRVCVHLAAGWWMFIVLLIILLLFVYYNLAEKGHSHTDVHILGWFYFWKATPTMLLHASNRWQSTRTQPPLIAGYEWFVMKIVHSPCFPSFRCAVHLERKIINNGKRMGIVLVSETHTHTHTARHILHSLDHHRKPSIGLL